MKTARALLLALLSAVGFCTGAAHARPEDDFWRWFQRNEALLFDFERDREHIFDLLALEIRKVHPSLTFEFGPRQANRREFVISADGIREAFPKVESLFASAPSLPKWKFVKFRPRREPADLEYHKVKVKFETVSVLLRQDGQKAGITVVIPGYTGADHQTYLTIAFLFLDQALGEYDVETRVGFIAVQPPSPATAGARPLRELPQAFDAFFQHR